MAENPFAGYADYRSQQYAKAYPKLLESAKSGNAEAQCMLGTLYQNGLGVAINQTTAAYWYELSSNQGYGVATNNLAGIRFLEGDVEGSKKLYQKSKNQGFEHAPVV